MSIFIMMTFATVAEGAGDVLCRMYHRHKQKAVRKARYRRWN